MRTQQCHHLQTVHANYKQKRERELLTEETVTRHGKKKAVYVCSFRVREGFAWSYARAELLTCAFFHCNLDGAQSTSQCEVRGDDVGVSNCGAVYTLLILNRFLPVRPSFWFCW